jgi:hypothetical protein
MMDEKGFAFTPLAFLLMIPVIIVAVAFTGIVNDLNSISQIAIGGDVTYTAANNVYISIENGAKNSGRNAAYNASRSVIDNEALRMTNPFFTSGTSKNYIAGIILDGINTNVVATCLKLESETGRQIYVNKILIDSYNDKPIQSSDITIYQTEPFSYNVNVTKGINITVTQNGQNATVKTPITISVNVPLEGIEDPYIWVKTKDRRSAIIYQYPYYSYSNQAEFHFADAVYPTYLQHLFDCLNGTNNPSGIGPRPYYFTDPNGLTFFDRLEGKSSSTDTIGARMTTFVIGDPLSEDYNGQQMSRVDHEYFSGVLGNETIKINGNILYDPWSTPAQFRLSTNYLNFFGLQRNY